MNAVVEAVRSPRALLIVRLLAALLVAALAMRPGFVRFGEWLSSQSADNYHFEYDYLGAALLWFALPVAAAAIALTGFMRDNVRIMIGGVALAFVFLLVQPFIFERDAPFRNSNVLVTDAELRAAIDAWRAKSGKAPFARDEVRQISPSGKPTHMRRGQQIFNYRFIVAGVRDDPFTSPPVAAEPGDIYYTISADEKNYALSYIVPADNVSPTLRVAASPLAAK